MKQLLFALAALALSACSHLQPGEKMTLVLFHGDASEGCVCGGSPERLVCECEPEAVKKSAGIWR